MRAGVKALGFCAELSTAATMWRPAVAREFVARAGEGSRGGEQGRSRERTTRGGHPSRRWSGGGRAALRSKAPRWPQGGGAEQSSTCPRKKKRGEGSGGLFGNFKNLRDLSVKQDFPLI
jgi:hypothetical protein